MSARNSRKNPAKPATRSNYIATPAANQPRDTTLPQGMQDDRDTESPKGARDAGPAGSQHPRVDEPKTPPQLWDTGVPQSPRDAGPSGLRRPWTDEPPARTHSAPGSSRDTVAPQGSRDAGPSSTRHSGVDETPRQRPQNSALSELAPRRRSEIGVKALQTDSKGNYERWYGKQPEHHARPRASIPEATPTPTNTPTIPSEDECLELPRRNFPMQSRRAEDFTASQPQSSASGSYAFVGTPNSEDDNPMFAPDPVLFQVRKLTQFMKAPRGRGQAMSEALHVLFHEVERAQAFPTPIIEVRDNVGVKRFKFYPDYADQLTLAMHLVSSTLNDYLMAARKPKTFSFGRSSHYDMEFSDLVYRRWATRLVLESFERRILARIQLAKEAIESFITESEFKPGTGPPRIASPA